MCGLKGKTLSEIFSERVKGFLRVLPASADALEISKLTRREFEPELARRVAELHALRQRGTEKFDGEVPYYFTRKGVEQASPHFVATYRAQRIAQQHPNCDILDATCSIGADSLAFARAGLRPTACDLDFFLLRCARENLRDAGFDTPVVQADAARPALHGDIYFADPDRRAEGRRTSDPEHWSPKLSQTLVAAARFQGGAIKMPPALDVDRAELPESANVSWISRDRRLFETTLWLGSLAGDSRREAIVLKPDGSAARFAGTPQHCAPLEEEAARAIRWIAEVDPAVLRAGFLGNVAIELGLAPLAAEIAYLGSSEKPAKSEFARAWPVLGVASVHPRPVRALLAKHDIGPLVVKKRGHPEDAETLAKKLRGKGKKRGLLFVSRLADGHAAYLVGPPEGS